MISDHDNEIKVKKYAAENNYTILADTFGKLEYVKYCYKDLKITEFLMWSKGATTISITKNGTTKKLDLREI